MILNKVIFWGVVAVTMNICTMYGQSDNIKSALANKDYQSVILALESSNSIKDNAESLFVRGQSYAELGLANKALPDLARAKTLGLNDPKLFKYLGKTYHLRNRYDEAIKWYKLYLENLPKNSKENTEEILNLIKQCNYADKIESNESIIVQHCDGDINSIYDEVRPIFSRTAFNKIYYTVESNTKNRIQGTEFVEGLWSTEANLPTAINAKGENSLSDISGDGQVLFFTNIQSKKTYSLYNKLVAADKNYFYQAPYFPHLGDTDLQLVDNNTIVFASLRPDSYGGYDIYMSKFKGGKWTDPTNLGDDINGAYNDRSPFMTADGKQLYFSSDRLESLGGFDIFKSSKSTVESKGYKKAKNVGAPINSAGDDLHFRVDGNGLRCTFNSNRIGGNGGLDIYLAYLNIPSSQIIVDAAHLDYIKYDSGQLTEIEEKKETKVASAQTQETLPKPTAVSDQSTKVDTPTKQEVSSVEQKTTPIAKPVKEDNTESKKKEAENAAEAKQIAKQEKKKQADLEKEAKRLKKEEKIAEKKLIAEQKEIAEQEEAAKKKAIADQKEKEKAESVASSSKKETLEKPTSKTHSKTKDPKSTRSTKEIAKEPTSRKSNAGKSTLKTMVVPTLYYASEQEIFSIANRNKLDTLAKYLNALPEDVIVELTNFSKESPRKEYELFFSINQLDPVVEYLEDKGISKERMIVNSVGSSYPIAEANLGGQTSDIHLAMNQRIEATFYNVPEGVSEAEVKLNIPLSKQAKDYPIYKSVKDDIHYRLEFAETTHIFKNRVLTYYNDIIITLNLETQNYVYALGFFQTYQSALEAQRVMISKNKLPDTEIVAYNGSLRLNKSEVLKLASKHASLRPFMDKI